MGRLGDASAANYKLLTNGTYGLSYLNTDLDKLLTGIIQGSGTALPSNKSLYDVVALDRLDHVTYGLSALRTLLDLMRTELTFQHQADATLNQSNPVSGTKYTVLDTTANVRIYGAMIVCTWTVQPDPLELWITIDGQTIRNYFTNPVSGTRYMLTKDERNAEDSQEMNALQWWQYNAFAFEGRSVKVEAEITGGTVSNLTARVKYAKR